MFDVGFHGDWDADGDLDMGDYSGFGQCFTGSDNPYADPNCFIMDFDEDGDVDLADQAAFGQHFTGPDVLCDDPMFAKALDASRLDNPYYFTGRRLDLIDDGQGLHRQLYHYRAREYDPRHGRFLQRDPAEYEDGMNLYEYAASNPTAFADPSGLTVSMKNAALRAIDAEARVHKEYLYYRNDLAKLKVLLQTLKADLGTLDAEDFRLDQSLGRSARWHPGDFWTHRGMYLGSTNPEPAAVIHEAIHARNFLHNWHQGSHPLAVADDEGNANAVQQMIATLIYLRKLEDLASAGNAPSKCNNIKDYWRDFWRELTVSVVGWSWESTGQAGTVTATDVWDVNGKHNGFRFSCSKMVESYNTMILLSVPADQPICCILECTKDVLGVDLTGSPFE